MKYWFAQTGSASIRQVKLRRNTSNPHASAARAEHENIAVRFETSEEAIDFPTLHRRCACLDVHSDSVVVCVRLTVRTKASHEVPFFNGNAGSVGAADWLAALGVKHVAMEATDIYWTLIWHILEGRLELVLANAAYIRNVPGRKSDVNDAIWISDLLAHGLIRASSVPPAPIQDCGNYQLLRQPGRLPVRETEPYA